MWVSLEPNELDLVLSEVDAFQADNPGVQVHVENVPFGEIENKLFTSLAAGVAPDVVPLSYNTVARLIEQDLLTPPDFGLLTNTGDFLPEAMQGNFFNNVLYAPSPSLKLPCYPSPMALPRKMLCAYNHGDASG